MIKKIACTLLVASSLQAAFDEPIFPFDCAISGGWRADNLNLTESARSSHGHTLWNDKIDAQGLNVWQWGVKARTTLAAWTFYQHSFFLDNFYFRGSAYRGWINGGTFREGPLSHFVSSSSWSFPSSSSSSSSRPVSSSSSSSSSWSSSWSSSGLERQTVRHGCTIDADIAAGFNFPVCWWFDFAPVFGYSFDKQKIDLRDVNIRQDYTSKWKGPFVGVDLASEVCYFRFRGGYEYHWGEWCGAFDIKAKKRKHQIHFHPYHDKRNATAIHGHVAWLDLRVAWTDQADLGLGLKYQYFHAPKGRITQRDRQFLGSSGGIRLSDISWRSFGVMGEIVYRF